MSRRLTIAQLARTTADGETEVLPLEPGVNVIVGPQNSGKSTWLRMFDYLMGETESAAEKFDEVLVRKYRAVSATLRIGDETVVLERQWTEDGKRSSMTLDGAHFPVAEVQSLFLKGLGIPELRFPQGNVWVSERAWPALGWRSLLRHIYRRQNFWSDLVPQQPESEQQACLLQFLGLAEYLFSDELAALVDKRRRITRLQSRKDFFVEMMHEIAPDLVGEEEMSVGLTAQSIEAARSRVRAEVSDLIASREALLTRVRDEASQPGGELAELLEERIQILHYRDSSLAVLETVGARIDDLVRYRSGLRQELERLGRADVAATIFEDVRVTHCPACDQSVEGRGRTHDRCFLCGQPTPDAEASAGAAERRLKFERDQIAAELAEADELLQSVEGERAQVRFNRAQADQRLRAIEAALRPFQSAVSAILPEEVALIDQRIGASNAKIEALSRLHGPLETRDALSKEIDALQAETRRLEATLAEKEEKAELEAASNRLSDGFNTYLNAIRQSDENSWIKSGAVSVRVSERRTQYLIAGRPAKPQLGGTLTIFFLFAYHYALLNLSRFPDCHYPGLTVLDFFPDIAKGASIRDRLGLVLSPFVQLARDQRIAPVQVIATSRDFPPQPNVHLVPLTQTWR